MIRYAQVYQNEIYTHSGNLKHVLELNECMYIRWNSYGQPGTHQGHLANWKRILTKLFSHNICIIKTIWLKFRQNGKDAYFFLTISSIST